MSFAGGFAQGFNQTFFAGKQAQARDKYAKLQSQIVELQLKQAKDVEAAQKRFQDMISGSVGEAVRTDRQQVPQFTFPEEGQVGEIGRTDRQQVPQFDFTGQEPITSLDELTSNLPALMAGVQAGIIDFGDILQHQGLQQQRAMVEGGNQQLMQMFSGTGQEGAASMFMPSSITTDPVTGRMSTTWTINPEFRTPMQQQAGAFSLGQLHQFSVDASNAMDILEKTLTLKTGPGPVGDLSTVIQSIASGVGGVFGFDVQDMRAAVSARGTLQKVFSNILMIRMNRLMQSGEQITNDKLRALSQGSPNLQFTAETNMGLMADFLEEELAVAERQRTPIPESEKAKIREFIAKARRGKTKGGKGPAPGGTVDFADMPP